MKIALTYDLRAEYLALGLGEEETAEFDREETVIAIETALHRLGHQTERVGHVRQLIERLAAGQSWDLVFNICEGLGGLSRESQVPALLDVYGIPYTFSDALVMALTLHKGLTKRVFRDAGLATPAFAVVKDLEDLASIDLPYPLFVKPAAEGTGKGISPASIVREPDGLPGACEALLDRYRQPVLVETFLPGRELTVGLLGSGYQAEVLGTLEIVLRPSAEPNVYSYVNKERCEDLVDYHAVSGATDDIVREAEALALSAWRLLDCRDGGRIDLRCDAEGHPQLLEINPLAGLHPEHSDLPMIATAVGMPYVDLIERIIGSAFQRVPGADQKHPALRMGQPIGATDGPSAADRHRPA